MTRGSGTWAGTLSQFQFNLLSTNKTICFREQQQKTGTLSQFQFNSLSTNKTICFRKQQQKPGTLSQAGISRGDFSISSRICDSARIHQVLYFKTFKHSRHRAAPFTFSNHVPFDKRQGW